MFETKEIKKNTKYINIYNNKLIVQIIQNTIKVISKMSNEKVMMEFQEFGSRMSIIAILAILNFVLPVMGLIELIFIFMALGNIKRICIEAPNMNLMEFRSKYIIAFVISLFGAFSIFSAAIGLVLFFIYFNWVYGFITVFVTLLLFGITILIVSGYLEYKAWDNLRIYFENNRSMFPETIVMDSIKGAKNLKLGAIFTMTIILSIVGVILRIIGFFQLASLKRLFELRGPPLTFQPTISQLQINQPKMIVEEPNTAGKFCPYCGTQLKSDAKFCSACGAQI